MLAAAISAGFAFFIPKADRGKAKMYFFPTLLGVLFLALMVWGRTQYFGPSIYTIAHS
jgi:hypothetical protein